MVLRTQGAAGQIGGGWEEVDSVNALLPIAALAADTAVPVAAAAAGPDEAAEEMERSRRAWLGNHVASENHFDENYSGESFRRQNIPKQL
eukprot:gene14738-biopygen9180